MNNNELITYRITPYTIYPLNKESWVLQTTERINIIDNLDLIDLISNLQKKKYITSTNLNKLIELKIKDNNLLPDVLNYLKNNNLILQLKHLNFKLSTSLFLTNDSKIFNFYKSHYFDKVCFLDNLKNIKFHENQLVIVILNPYNPGIVKQLYEKLNNKNTYLVLGFFYNFKFYIDNIYHPNLQLPDHFDHLKYIQTNIYSQETNYTYQDLINIIFEEDPKFNLTYPVSWLDIVMLTSVLMKHIIKIFDLDESTNLYMSDEILKLYTLDMKSYMLNTDYANFLGDGIMTKSADSISFNIDDNSWLDYTNKSFPTKTLSNIRKFNLLSSTINLPHNYKSYIDNDTLNWLKHAERNNRIPQSFEKKIDLKYEQNKFKRGSYRNFIEKQLSFSLFSSIMFNAFGYDMKSGSRGYGSGGALYPVNVLIFILKDNIIHGLSRGVYYFYPMTNSLYLLNSLTIADEKLKFALYPSQNVPNSSIVIAYALDLRKAIRKYQYLGYKNSLIEVGLMAQALKNSLPNYMGEYSCQDFNSSLLTSIAELNVKDSPIELIQWLGTIK